MFADDTEIDSAAKPVCSAQLESNINSDLCKVKQYFDINKLSINVQKCQFMLIGTHQSIAKMADVRIHINNEPLKHVSVAKYLGMYIDSNLKWDDHINSMIPKMSSKIGILRSHYQIVSINILRQLYNAIVQLHFDYGDVIYDSATAPTKTRLQKLQATAATHILGKIEILCFKH